MQFFFVLNLEFEKKLQFVNSRVVVAFRVSRGLGKVGRAFYLEEMGGTTQFKSCDSNSMQHLFDRS